MNGSEPIVDDGNAIAERRIAELELQVRELRRVESQFRMLLETSPDAVVIVDESGEIMLANRQSEKMFGYASGELLGLPVEMLVPDRFRESHVLHRDHYARCPPRSSHGN